MFGFSHLSRLLLCSDLVLLEISMAKTNLQQYYQDACLMFETEDFTVEYFCANCRKWDHCFTAEGAAAHNYSMTNNWLPATVTEESKIAWGLRACKERASRKVPNAVAQFEKMCQQVPTATQVVNKVNGGAASSHPPGARSQPPPPPPTAAKPPPPPPAQGGVSLGSPAYVPTLSACVFACNK